MRAPKLQDTALWDKPAETAQATRPDGFRTGEVAFTGADAWFY